MLRVQLGLFIATLLTGIVALYQAHVSSVSAEAAKSTAETASQTMAAMKTSATESTTQVTAVIDHLNSLAGSMKASVGQGRDVLKASIDASRHEYRPWITFTAALTFLPLDLAYDTPFYNSEVVTTLQPNRGIVGRIALNNIGRSPARNVVVHLRLVYVETHSPTQILEFGERAFQDAFRKDLIVRTHITLAPGEIRATFSNNYPSLSATNIATITSGVGAFILAGEIDYADADNGPHTTEVCAIFTGPSMVEATNCGVRSDMK